MEKFITNAKSIFFQKQTFWLLIFYFFIRIFSFYISGHAILQGIIVFLILMLMGILYFKKPEWSWYLVLGELFLCGSGHYLEFMGLSIRTLMILFFLFLWFSYTFGQTNFKEKLTLNSKLTILLFLLFIILGISIITGLSNGHEMTRVIQDLLPFSFLLLIFPAFHLFSQPKSQEYLVRLLLVFIIGTAIFSIITFILFSTGTTEIHQEFYKWYRDINVGKITDMGQNFFRIVEPEHLVIVPFMLILVSLLMRQEKHHKMWRVLLFLCTIVLTLNLSRGYFLALMVGLLILKYKHRWWKWFRESFILVMTIIITFTGIHYLSSGGTSLGLDLFGLRIKSFASPGIEISTQTRMMVLPAIIDMIKIHPIIGSGLGANVIFLNTATLQNVSTPHFDWGYLEMWTETGLFGMIIITCLYLLAIYLLIKKVKNIPDWHDFDVGLIAGLVAFLIMNITIASLFHVFGILFLIFSMAIALKDTIISERTTTILYQIFNKQKTLN